MKLTIATCEFPIESDLRCNARYVCRQMRAAKDGGAHVVHFPESALVGYPGSEFGSFKGFDWGLLVNQAGILFSTVDTKAQLYEASGAWRDRAMRGIHHGGTVVNDRRSQLRRRS